MNRTIGKKGRDFMHKKTNGIEITYFCERTSMSFNEDAQICKCNIVKYFWYGGRRYKRKKKFKYLLLTYVQYQKNLRIDRSFSFHFFPSFSEIIQFFTW